MRNHFQQSVNENSRKQLRNKMAQCLVCNDPPEKENQIIKCNKCEVHVHILCYGIENIETFVCSPCSADVIDVNCTLCKKYGGALKNTTDEKWVHVVCGLFTKGVIFTDKISMEPVDVTKVKFRKNLKCVFCNESHGAMKCARKSI